MALMIILGVINYLLVGVGVLMWWVKTDDYGGYFLYVWWLVVLFYPMLIVRSFFER